MKDLITENRSKFMRSAKSAHINKKNEIPNQNKNRSLKSLQLYQISISAHLGRSDHGLATAPFPAEHHSSEVLPLLTVFSMERCLFLIHCSIGDLVSCNGGQSNWSRTLYYIHTLLRNQLLKNPSVNIMERTARTCFPPKSPVVEVTC